MIVSANVSRPLANSRSLVPVRQDQDQWAPKESVSLSRAPAPPLLSPKMRSKLLRGSTKPKSGTLTSEEKEAWRKRFGEEPLKRSLAVSEPVRHLQSFLNQREASNVIVDGQFGPMTEVAVKCAQKRLSLEPSGVFDPETREALLSAEKIEQDPLKLTPMEKDLWNKRFGDKTLKRGRNNRTNVRHLQSFLNQRERSRLTTDGDFGPATERAVRAAQSRLGLEPSGVFDSKTRTTLLNAAKKVPETGNGHSAVKGRIQEILRTEHHLFGRQSVAESGRVTKRGRRENETGFDKRVGDYWSSIGLNYDGDDRGVPWSAAFISFAHKTAGAGEQFKAGPAHARYIRDSISAKKEGRTDAAYLGHRSSERAPQVGDLIGRARQGGIDYDNQPEFYKSHTDIVVEVGDGFVKMIGGNVADSVSETTVSTDAKGFIRNQAKYFVVMEPNDLSGPEEARVA